MELVPLNVWHMRHTSNLHIPVLDLPWKYQYRHQLSQYLQKRDRYTDGISLRWQSTEIDFANSVHPIPQHYTGSYWKAARRTSLLYDWKGRGYNHFKKSKRSSSSPAQLTPHVPCKYCGQHDDQSHIMLQCTKPLLSPIRIAARVKQARIVSELQSKTTSRLESHFIEQLHLASWLSTSPTTARIWTGMWTKDTLAALFPSSHDMLSPMAQSDRHKYRCITRRLTQPLIEAYKQMICVGTTAPAPLHDYLQTRPISSQTKHHTSLLFHQQAHAAHNNQLDHLYMSSNNSYTAFSYSDAAFSLTDAEVGTIVHNL